MCCHCESLPLLVIARPRRGRSNLSFVRSLETRDCHVASLLAMTYVVMCGLLAMTKPHLVIARPRRGRSNLSFSGTRDCYVGTKTVPLRNDIRGKAALLGKCNCEPAEEVWQSHFCASWEPNLLSHDKKRSWAQ